MGLEAWERGWADSRSEGVGGSRYEVGAVGSVSTRSGELRRIRLTLYAEGASCLPPSSSYESAAPWTSLRLPGVSSVSKESFVALANHDKGVVTRDLREENMEIEREGGGLLV